MQREEPVDLNAFLTLAEEQSFTRAHAATTILWPALESLLPTN